MRPKRLHLGYLVQITCETGWSNEASMRPKRLHLGYRRTYWPSSCDPRCFNEAQASPLGISTGVRHPRSILRASMRPKRLHLGYLTRPALGSTTDTASMRPKRLHLGYHYRDRRGGARRVASMRPKRLHLGYPACPASSASSKSASMRPKRLHLGYRRPRPGPPRPAPTRFNEAQASPLGISWDQARTTVRDKELQ